MGHHAEHIAVAIEDSGDRPGRPVALLAVAEDDAAIAFEAIERFAVSLIIAVVMGDRNEQLLTLLVAVGEESLAVLDSDRDGATDVMKAGIAHQCTGKQPSLGQYLKSVADADHRHAAV